MTTDPHPWAVDLNQLYAQVWARLVQGVEDRDAPARHPTLATVTPDGLPDLRTVVLRAADPLARTLDIHTDLRSAKVAALRRNPNAGLHVWDSAAFLQTRIMARVDILTGAAVAAIWARVPQASQPAYGTQPAPGTPIEGALDYHKTPDPDAFAVLRLSVQSIDAVHLGPQHRRARFDLSEGWLAQWLAP